MISRARHAGRKGGLSSNPARAGNRLHLNIDSHGLRRRSYSGLLFRPSIAYERERVS
jgi:hypothetical protein